MSIPINESLEDLVVRAQEGDSTAFTLLFEHFHTAICTYLAHMVGNAEEGRDLAQETFLRAWKSLPHLHEALSFKVWLYQIATNVGYSHLRRRRLTSWISQEELDVGKVDAQRSVSGPEEGVSETEIVEYTLAQISPKQRTCLILRIILGFSQREVAEMLGISETSVGAYVCRGREQFRQVYIRMKGNML